MQKYKVKALITRPRHCHGHFHESTRSVVCVAFACMCALPTTSGRSSDQSMMVFCELSILTWITASVSSWKVSAWSDSLEVPIALIPLSFRTASAASDWARSRSNPETSAPAHGLTVGLGYICGGLCQRLCLPRPSVSMFT